MIEHRDALFKLWSLFVGILVTVNLLLLFGRGAGGTAHANPGFASVSSNPNIVTDCLVFVADEAGYVTGSVGSALNNGTQSAAKATRQSTGAVAAATVQGARLATGAAAWSARSNITAVMASARFSGHITQDSATFVGHSIWYSATFVGRSVGYSAAFVGRGTLDNLAFVAHTTGHTMGFVSNTAVMNSLIRPSDKVQTPVISPLADTAIPAAASAVSTSVPAQATAITQAATPTSTLRAEQIAANHKLVSDGAVDYSGSCGGGYPASATSKSGHWGCDYPLDNALDSWGMYNRECVSYVAWMVYKTYGYMPYWGGRGNANEWPADARAAGIPVSTTPKVGSVAIYMGGAGDPYGHAMWVAAVHGSTVTVQQYNLYYDGNYYVTTIPSAGLVYIYFDQQ